MNKITALVMAMILALSMPLALAETGGLVITSTINIDQDVVSEIIEAKELGEEAHAAIDPILTVLNAYSDRLTLADNGIGYELYLNDTEILSLTAGLTDEGFVLLSNLLPGWAVTLSDRTLRIIEIVEEMADLITQLIATLNDVGEEAVEIVIEDLVDEGSDFSATLSYIEAFANDLIAAIRFGEPEAGEFEYGDGTVYNTRIPVVLDVRAVETALINMLANVTRDEAVRDALGNVSVQEDALESLTQLAEVMPFVDAALYTVTDVKGETAPDMCFVITLSKPGQADVLAFLAFRMREDGCDCTLSIPGKDENDGISVGIDFTAFDAQGDTGSVALAVNYKGRYAAFTGMKDRAEDDSAVVYASAIYYLNADKPLASIATRIGSDEAATLDLNTEGRKIIALESLLDGEGRIAVSKLIVDAMLSGFDIVSTATEAVPGFGNLMAMFRDKEAVEAEAP